MILGDWQLDTVDGGRFRLDGGSMFGIVPKPLWEKEQPADDRNRIRLATNCVLVRDGTNTVLIDTGYGGKCSAKEEEQMDLEPGEKLPIGLAQLGLAVDEVDTVVLSHLHFDHAGGGTRRDPSRQIIPTFPNATYVIGRMEWEDATSGAAELRGTYPLENLLPLEEAGRLRLVDDGDEIVPGIKVLVTGCHTRGHQIIRLDSRGETAVYLGDLCPTHSHIRTFWSMSYDLFLSDTRRHKPRILGQAADESWLILWDHDPDMAAARIERHAKREFALVERYETL